MDYWLTRPLHSSQTRFLAQARDSFKGSTINAWTITGPVQMVTGWRFTATEAQSGSVCPASYVHGATRNQLAVRPCLSWQRVLSAASAARIWLIPGAWSLTVGAGAGGGGYGVAAGMTALARVLPTKTSTAMQDQLKLSERAFLLNFISSTYLFGLFFLDIKNRLYTNLESEKGWRSSTCSIQTNPRLKPRCSPFCTS